MPVFFVIFAKSMFQAYRKYGEESRLVIFVCILLLINPLMSQIFFDQQYLKGLVLIRQEFFWCSFFMYILLIRDLNCVERTFNLLTLLCGIYVFCLIITKYFPDIGIIHFDSRFYSKKGSLQRFGDFRLYFPYGTVPIFFYCITLARLLHAPKGDSLRIKTIWFVFLVIVFYAVLSTYTRMLVASILIVTALAFFSSKRPMLKFAAAFTCLLFISIVVLGKTGSDGDIGIIGDTKLAKMAMQYDKLQRESGREFQTKMFLDQMVKSPITGVGTIATRKDTEEEIGSLTTYRKYGFFNAVDVGYPKIAGENGLLGIIWVIWFFSYLYRRSRQTLLQAISIGSLPFVEAICRGHYYFLAYLIVSGITIGHFVHPYGLTIIALSLALLAVTRVSVSEMHREKDGFRNES